MAKSCPPVRRRNHYARVEGGGNHVSVDVNIWLGHWTEDRAELTVQGMPLMRSTEGSGPDRGRFVTESTFSAVRGHVGKACHPWNAKCKVVLDDIENRGSAYRSPVRKREEESRLRSVGAEVDESGFVYFLDQVFHMSGANRYHEVPSLKPCQGSEALAFLDYNSHAQQGSPNTLGCVSPVAPSPDNRSLSRNDSGTCILGLRWRTSRHPRSGRRAKWPPTTSPTRENRVRVPSRG